MRAISTVPILLPCLVQAAFGQLLLQHAGSRDPGLSGWARQGNGDGVTASAIINDLDQGVDAWSIDDDVETPDHLYYSADLAEPDRQLVNQNGWRLTVRLRVVDFPTSVAGASASNNSIAVRVRPGDGGRNFDLIVGSGWSDGMQCVIANGIYQSGPEYAEIVVEHLPRFGEWGQASLTMAINGHLRYTYTDPTPNGSGSAYVAWGCFGGVTVGEGAWNLVRFEALPPVEPPAVTSIILDDTRIWLTLGGIRKGVYYQIRQSQDLMSDSWALASGFRAGQSGVLSWSIGRTSAPRLFFRVNTK